jgi:hypothetical protein
MQKATALAYLQKYPPIYVCSHDAFKVRRRLIELSKTTVYGAHWLDKYHEHCWWQNGPLIEKETTYMDDLTIAVTCFKNKFLFHMHLKDTHSPGDWNYGPKSEFFILSDEYYTEVESSIIDDLKERAYNLIQDEDREKFRKRMLKIQAKIKADLCA